MFRPAIAALKTCGLGAGALATSPLFAHAAALSPGHETIPPIEATQTLAPSALPALPTGTSQFRFSQWAGPEITVFAHVPAHVDPRTAPILIVMHGVRRNADSYRDAWVEHADTGGFIIAAPEFSREAFPRSDNYNLGGIFNRETGRWRPQEQWTFSAIEPLFDDLVARLGGSQTHYTLYGHSAGSQFVHRFLWLKPNSRAKRMIAANAGWYTFPDMDIAFPHGLGQLGYREAALRRALSRDVVIALGDADTDARQRSLNRSTQSMRQGRHRFARGQAFFNAAKDLAEERGWPFGWSLRVVPGVAHSNSGMAAGSFDLVE